MDYLEMHLLPRGLGPTGRPPGCLGGLARQSCNTLILKRSTVSLLFFF